MGLDTSHDCWHGPYAAFMRWRVWLAKQVGLPLGLMHGFAEFAFEPDDLDSGRDLNAIYAAAVDTKRGQLWWDTLKATHDLGGPISWNSLQGDPITILLSHSDCDGRIRWWDCKPLAIRLGRIVKAVADDDPRTWPGTWRERSGNYDGMVPTTKRFIAGLLRAYKAREDVIFR